MAAPTPGAELEVAAIVDDRGAGGAERAFRVRWKGFGAEKDTWEPEANLAGCRCVTRLPKSGLDRGVRCAYASSEVLAAFRRARDGPTTRKRAAAA